MIARQLIHSVAVALGLAVLALSGGCDQEEKHPDAEPFIARHYKTLLAKDYDAVLAEYAPQFFVNQKKEAWLATLKDLAVKEGPYQRHSIIGLSQFKKKDEAGDGSYVNVVCRTTYGKRQLQERLTLFKGLKDQDYKIVRHYISRDDPAKRGGPDSNPRPASEN